MLIDHISYDLQHLVNEFKMNQQKNLKCLFQRIVGPSQIVVLQVSCDLRVILQNLKWH